MADPNNLYCGRPHPILGDNKLGNLYKVRTYGRDKCIELYKKHQLPTITNEQIEIIKTKTFLSCFCETSENCHVSALIDYIVLK